jgi:hypothetical protein
MAEVAFLELVFEMAKFAFLELWMMANDVECSPQTQTLQTMALMREVAVFRIKRRCTDDSKIPLLFEKKFFSSVCPYFSHHHDSFLKKKLQIHF